MSIKIYHNISQTTLKIIEIKNLNKLSLTSLPKCVFQKSLSLYQKKIYINKIYSIFFYFRFASVIRYTQYGTETRVLCAVLYPKGKVEGPLVVLKTCKKLCIQILIENMKV